MAPFMSEAPRPQSLPSRTSPENGPAPLHCSACSGVTGTTSVCADHVNERPSPDPLHGDDVGPALRDFPAFDGVERLELPKLVPQPLLGRSLGKVVGLQVRIDRRLPNELRRECDDFVCPLVDSCEHARQGRCWYRLHDVVLPNERSIAVSCQGSAPRAAKEPVTDRMRMLDAEAKRLANKPDHPDALR